MLFSKIGDRLVVRPNRAVVREGSIRYVSTVRGRSVRYGVRYGCRVTIFTFQPARSDDYQVLGIEIQCIERFNERRKKRLSMLCKRVTIMPPRLQGRLGL